MKDLWEDVQNQEDTAFKCLLSVKLYTTCLISPEMVCGHTPLCVLCCQLRSLLKPWCLGFWDQSHRHAALWLASVTQQQLIEHERVFTINHMLTQTPWAVWYRMSLRPQVYRNTYKAEYCSILEFSNLICRRLDLKTGLSWEQEFEKLRLAELTPSVYHRYMDRGFWLGGVFVCQENPGEEK